MKSINFSNSGNISLLQNIDFICKYAINIKIIFKLIDEDYKLEMKLMEQLPKRVYEDIMDEEGKEILMSRWIVDFGKLRKLITKRCLAVLQQVIVNNGLNNGN